MAKRLEKEFELVNRIIERHWNRAVGLANAESLMTYWTVGAFVSERLKNAQWGSKTVEALSDYLKTRNPKRRGFGKRHIYNMVSFYDTYTSPEFQNISERLRLHEFVQSATAQIEDGTCAIANCTNWRLLVPEDVMEKSLEEYCAFMKQAEVKHLKKAK